VEHPPFSSAPHRPPSATHSPAHRVDRRAHQLVAAESPLRTAVIDMGSNSFRLVAYSYVPGRWWRRTDEIYDTVRIGAGLHATGRLAEDRMETAIEAMEVYAHFCAATGIGVGDVRAVATSAIRDAENGGALLARVRAATGLPARVLSSEEEAYYAYLAAVNSTSLRDGAVLDLGGGSLQLVRVLDREVADSASWPLGTVRMTERFLENGKPASPKQRQALRSYALKELRRATWLERLGGPIVGIGGTVRNLAAAAADAAGKPSIGVQGAVLERDALKDLIGELAARGAADRAQVEGIKPGRAGVILAGAVVVAAAMDAAGADRIEVTHAGLREGVFFSSYLAPADPPLFEDVRVASVRNLASHYQADLVHCTHVASLAGQLLSSLEHRVPRAAGLDGAQLLWAAGMLHDIGVSVDYDDHHKHSRYLILAAGLPGYSQRELSLIAQIVRYHRKGTPELGELAPLCLPGDEQFVERMASLLRLAEHLDRGRDGAVVRASLREAGRRLDLELVVDGDPALARWGAERQSDLFRRAFGKPLTLT
jgi:exopolyphosphatase/guanosine-5'-triphosphate,3'-diphosphate pyrophosphatase